MYSTNTNHNDLRSGISIAISKYVFLLGSHEKSGEILSQLSSSSVRLPLAHTASFTGTSHTLLWNKPNTLQANLEITSRSFLSILQSQAKPTETLVPLESGLLSTGNSEKIPTHLMALDAMIGFAREMNFGAKNLSIHFTSDSGDSEDLRVNSSNVHVIQTVRFNSATRKVRLDSVGKGFALINIKSRYNVQRRKELCFDDLVT